jgi:hypothetical protein
MGCCRVPAGYVLFVPVLFMWNVVVLLLMLLLGAADCVVASYVFVIIIKLVIFTDTHNVAKHSAQVHSALATLSVTAGQGMHGGNQQTRQQKQGILHSMFISGHAQASPEATSARPSKHAYRGTIQQEVPLNQAHAELPQSTSHKHNIYIN